jgi:uncharacterized RDD family membrane protein YckC
LRFEKTGQDLTLDLTTQPNDADSEPLLTPGLMRRMACWCYEGMLLFAVVFLAAYLFSALSQTRHALDNRHAQQAFIFLILGIYFTWFWSKGQTLAMKTWNIRLVDTHGRPVTQKRALWRFALSWLWFLPPLAGIYPFNLSGAESTLLITGWVVVWALLSRFHPDGQFWHDAMAKTRLVSSRPLSR